MGKYVIKDVLPHPDHCMYDAIKEGIFNLPENAACEKNSYAVFNPENIKLHQPFKGEMIFSPAHIMHWNVYRGDPAYTTRERWETHPVTAFEIESNGIVKVTWGFSAQYYTYVFEPVSTFDLSFPGVEPCASYLEIMASGAVPYNDPSVPFGNAPYPTAEDLSVFAKTGKKPQASPQEESCFVYGNPIPQTQPKTEEAPKKKRGLFDLLFRS